MSGQHPERDAAFRGIAEDLQVASEMWRLLEHVRLMFKHRRPAVRLAGSFMWLAIRAFRDDLAIHLWKVYDNQSDARSLRWFVRTYSLLDADVKQEDLALLDLRRPAVARLRKLRHEVFAHHGKEKVARGRDALMREHELSDDDISSLIENGRRILCRHAQRQFSLQLGVMSGDALSELIDLDVHLEDTFRGRYGLERFDWSQSSDIFP